MSYSLAVQDGDLVQQGSSLLVVWGIDKLKQDLQLWVTERFGGDRFHPDMGTILQDYIGGIVGHNTKAKIQDEVMRVVDNYHRVQIYGFKRNPRIYSSAELLNSIDDISVSVSYDTVSVSVAVTSAAGADGTITVTEGV
jgi:phage baseplate assembly protein W